MAHPQIQMNDAELFDVSRREDSKIINPFEMNTVRIEHRGDNTIYHYAQDVSAICNDNEEERKEETRDGRSEFRKCASIPMVVWNLWESMGITQDQRELRRAIERHKHELKTTNKRLI